MIIRVRAFARLREIFGSERRVDVPEGSAMSDLLAVLGAESELHARALFDDDGSPKKNVILMRNGKRVNHAEIPVLALAGGDEVALFPPVAGG